MKKSAKLALALLLAALAADASAEWISVEKFEDGTEIFADPASAQRRGDLAELRHLVRWGEPQMEDGRPPYRSTVVFSAYNCNTRAERYLGSTSYAGSMGDGEKIESDKEEAETWVSVSDASMEEKLWAFACDSVRP